ncbi:hypothetical protein BB558_006651 [Smittium angustum]|uniref:MULE transposase domain-containing protein n=1 Tax=Smittium angustum TaxID=133377 RepID=A0A2U1IX49_SMIAN|nr:hypothetical protein BB558_006651 [Smittium angustum]
MLPLACLNQAVKLATLQISTNTSYNNFKSYVRTSSKAKLLHIDGTFKLIKGNYLVIFAGVSNVNQSFVPTAIAIVSNDTEASYVWFLNTILKEIKRYNLSWNIENVVADSAQ